jgi:hypothetical protein
MIVKNGVCTYTIGSESRSVDLFDRAALNAAIVELKKRSLRSLIAGLLEAARVEYKKPANADKVSDPKKSLQELNELATKEVAVSEDAFIPPPPPPDFEQPKKDWRKEREIEQQRLFGLGLSLEFTSALKEYISSGYRLINSTLRMEDKYYNPHDVTASNGPEGVYSRIDLLVKSLLRQPGYSNERGYLLRGWACDDKKLNTRFVKYSHFVDNAFVSTGAGDKPFSPKSGRDFILMKIVLPPGLKGDSGHPGKKVLEASVGAFAGEDEVLFPPATKFVVRDARRAQARDNQLVDDDLHGKFKYYAELVALRIEYNEQSFHQTGWYKDSKAWLLQKYGAGT